MTKSTPRTGFRSSQRPTARMTPANFPSIRKQRQARTPRRSGGGPLHVALLIWLSMTCGCAALKDREQIIRVSTSRNSAEAARLTLVGIKALDNGEVDRAGDKFLSAIEADDTYGPAHNSLGLMHFEDGDLFQAVLEFERAMELMPQDPDVYYNLGLTLETAGKVFEAMDLYLQATEMDPTNPLYLGNLVRLRIRLGEDDPSLITQLQDLILIETRPDWRRWADQQLALTFNPTLDRGPDPPEFDTGGKKDEFVNDDAYLKSKIIELSPTSGDAGRFDLLRGCSHAHPGASACRPNPSRCVPLLPRPSGLIRKPFRFPTKGSVLCPRQKSGTMAR